MVHLWPRAGAYLEGFTFVNTDLAPPCHKMPKKMTRMGTRVETDPAKSGRLSKKKKEKKTSQKENPAEGSERKKPRLFRTPRRTIRAMRKNIIIILRGNEASV